MGSITCIVARQPTILSIAHFGRTGTHTELFLAFGRNELVVDLTITIIIESITQSFFAFILFEHNLVVCGSTGSPALRSFASLHRLRATAGLLGARLGCEVIIDLTIAIVIFAVTRLCLRNHFTCASLPFATIIGTCLLA
jgi:hypothetical protein